MTTRSDPLFFHRFLERVQKYYPPLEIQGGSCNIVGGCETGTSPLDETGFGNAQHQYLYQPLNYHYATTVIGMFRNRALVLNRCEDAYDPVQMHAISPLSVMVRSKFLMFSKAEQMITKVFRKYMNRKATIPEMQGLFNGVRSAQIDQDDIARQICLEKMFGAPSADDCFWVASKPSTQWAHRYPRKTYMWSVDLHSAPTSCQTPIITDAGGVIHAEVDFGNCQYDGSCKTDRLKVFENDKWRGFSLQTKGKKPDDLRREFFEAYKNSEEFNRVDMFTCSHPAANCELFFPFNRSLLIYATTRIEFGRDDNGIDWRQKGFDGRPEGWQKEQAQKLWRNWVKDLQQLARSQRHTIVANNPYDSKYITYMTGIKNVPLLPFWCGDIDDSAFLLFKNKHGNCLPPKWRPLRAEVIIGSYRNNLGRVRMMKGKSESSFESHPIAIGMRAAQERAMASSSSNATRHPNGVPAPIQIELISKLYTKGYLNSDLLTHPALVLIPYQVSTMGVFAFYRLNIPIFAPSLKLLLEWQRDHDIMWERIYGWPEPLVTPPVGVPSPNSESPEAVRYWLGLCDWYHWPHVVLFDSWDDLMSKLLRTDLVAVSASMKHHNKLQRVRLVETMRGVFKRAQDSGKTPIPQDFDASMRSQGLYVPPRPPPPTPPLTTPLPTKAPTIPQWQRCKNEMHRRCGRTRYHERLRLRSQLCVACTAIHGAELTEGGLCTQSELRNHCSGKTTVKPVASEYEL